MLEKILRKIEKFIPKKIYKFFQPLYHMVLSLIGTLIYRNPSKDIYVIGVTGTKGKSSTVEFVNAVLEASGKKTAALSTIRFKIGNDSTPNKYKMTMPGRFFTQEFLRKAVDNGCEYAVIEMTSEGARFYRHLGVEMDVLIFTNLSPEHIESHGSFENYKNAKLRLAKRLSSSKKKSRISIANLDNPHAYSFLIYPVEKNIGYSLSDVKIIKETDSSSLISYKGTEINIPIAGKFNISNAISAIKLGEELGLDIEKTKSGIENLSLIRGRVERVYEGQDFTAIVDYAHTDESIRKVFEIFKDKKKVVVFGSTGGGRDSWKRPVFGELAEEYCEEIIITNDDPYDEDPNKIMKEIASGVKSKTPHLILDRREAIKKGISLCKKDYVLFILGKGTDPYIMGPNGSRIPWDDATVLREELESFIKSKN